MSRVYDNWERLVGAVLKREELRDLALCSSISTSSDYMDSRSDHVHVTYGPGIITEERSDRRHDDPVKDGTVLSSEMDVSLNEFSSSSVSKVYVNGHLITDRVVKKAEKLAGPIHPGDYWYDIQAGFWGVMGHPCLGIIMPNIEEFNYPMPEKCAAGNTGVFVNGRELHRKDLDLLDKRGLPNTRNGSYQVDISGKVVDEHTGEELVGLGKLAPTVEKEKHGFGMKDRVKDGTVLASEMDVLLNEFSNSSVSQVYVNGHLIPDRVVKKAEKLAGPIHPGDYWYDIQAGFWGVMGQPCLGIIMPNIEEFNYPMPEKCAAGNTGVFVNGRELHRKDLDLLDKRGLPNTRNGSYQVDISGKVVDEHTGEELDGLGKLAPTVEKKKHGFGMNVPRFIGL